jgi:hypothetical protein
VWTKRRIFYYYSRWYIYLLLCYKWLTTVEGSCVFKHDAVMACVVSELHNSNARAALQSASSAGHVLLV